MSNRYKHFLFSAYYRYRSLAVVLFLLEWLFLLFPLILFSQIENANLNSLYRPQSKRKNELFLSLNEFSYFRNYEFFNNLQDGYTLFGTHFVPELYYYPDSTLLVSAGLLVRKDFGRNGFNDLQPLFAIKYQKNKITLINGVLEGSTQHKYVEPLYDVEYRITRPNEYGTQFIYKSANLQLDAWINWLQMQYKYEFIKEKIVGGLVSNWLLYKSNKWDIAIPYQFIAFHQGGQIDLSDQALKTFFSQAVGLLFDAHLQGFIKKITASAYYAYVNDQSNASAVLFKTSSGRYFNINLVSTCGSLGLSYWNAFNFFSPQGMPLFQTISNKINQEGSIYSTRNLLFIRYAYQQQLTKQLYLDIRLEPYVDLGTSSKAVELYHSLFLIYKQEFKLSK